jgi:hypothetical protein
VLVLLRAQGFPHQIHVAVSGPNPIVFGCCFAAGDFSLRDCCLHQCFALGSGVLPSSQNAPSISSAAEDFSNLCVTDFRLRLGFGPAECVQIEFYHS